MDEKLLKKCVFRVCQEIEPNLLLSLYEGGIINDFILIIRTFERNSNDWTCISIEAKANIVLYAWAEAIRVKKKKDN